MAENDRQLFTTMRRWRSETARRVGAPPYAILTNRQLVEVVLKKPGSLHALAQLDGLGAAKVERYGQALLALLHGQPSAPPTAAAPAAVAAGVAEANT